MANILGIESFEENFEKSNSVISEFELNVLNYPAYNYASPGDNRKTVMNVSIKSGKNDLELKELKVKILGVDPLAIEKAVLMKGDTVLLKASRKNEYLLFRNIDLIISKGSEETLSIAINLNDEMAVGERIRLELEKSGDVVFLIEGSVADLSEYYFPMQSPYLTVIKKKPKFKVIYK